MGKQRNILVSGLLAWGTLTTTAEEFRAFTDITGRTIEAQVEKYIKGAPFVLLKRKSGKTGKIPVDQLCAADHAYLNSWISGQNFRDVKLLHITIEENSSGWESLGDGRDKKSTSYKFFLSNNHIEDLKNLRAEYCLYRDRKQYIDSTNYSLELDSLPADRLTETKPRSGYSSYRRKSDDFLNHVVGVRLRVFQTMEEGTVFMREATWPENLPLETYVWKRGEMERMQEKAEMPDPTTYPAIEMTEDQIRAVAQDYIDAYLNNDRAAWKALLTPMHPGDRELDSDYFLYYHYRLKNISIKSIEGRNVELSMRYDDGNKISRWLQLTESGHIKYTPLRFRHPLQYPIDYISSLLSDDESRRRSALSSLKRADIPTFQYSVNGDIDQQEVDTYLILDWIQEHGAAFDTSQPRVPMAPQQLEQELEQAERSIKYSVERNY